MLADIKGRHLDFLVGPNSLSHGSGYGDALCRQNSTEKYWPIKAATLLFRMECSETQLLLRLWLVSTNPLSCSSRCAALRLHQVVR